MQLADDGAPSDSWYDPAAQLVQLTVPVTAAYMPSAQRQQLADDAAPVIVR